MPGVRTRPPSRPAVRLRAVPPLDPPFDDELPGPLWPTGLDGQLALPLPAPTRVPIARTTGPGRPGQQGPSRPPHSPALPLPPESLVTASDEARQAAHRFLSFCLEIFNGYRPATQVRSLSAGAEAVAVTEQLVTATRRLNAQRPGRAIRRPRDLAASENLVRVRRLRVCEPRAGIAEAAAVLAADGRCWAMAFRLERQRGNWLATVTRVL
ncbi:Rv3235 family protein [Micromonospora sp. NPDC050417]|uniref:Rv3235 family protein n=1 Tax=Micromonospora sp. NPDC050417 TaxID=3364280 RepID=UPI0037B034A4